MLNGSPPGFPHVVAEGQGFRYKSHILLQLGCAAAWADVSRVLAEESVGVQPLEQKEA